MLKGMLKLLTFGLVCFFAGYQIAVFTQSPRLIYAKNEQAARHEKLPQPSDPYEAQNQPKRKSIHTSQKHWQRNCSDTQWL